MIKINLLESVTDRPQGVAAVEEKVASPRMQTLLLALTVFGLMVVAMGYDYVSTNMAYTAAQKELDHQKRLNQQMLAIQKEQMELEKKSKEVEARINAIKKLRESQQGSLKVLHFAGKDFTRPLAILHRKGRVLTPAMRKFIDTLSMDLNDKKAD